jgi:LysM repeat protein
VWAALVVVLGLGLATASSGVGSSAAARLTIEARTGTASTVLVPSEARLTCEGTPAATGFLRRTADRACALVRRGTVEQVVDEQHSTRVCSMVYGGPQSARIRGTIKRRRVDLTVTRADGCGTAEWHTLETLLGDPERLDVIPKVATPPAPTTAAPPVTYPVQRGDTVTGIARRFGVSVAAIVATNHLVDPDHLVEGQNVVIPQAPPVHLDVTLVEAQGNKNTKGLQLVLSGAQPSEQITFQIDSPEGRYTGVPHSASADGVVTSTYQTSAGVTAGTYTAVATGDHGTTTQAAFRVDVARTANP